MYGYYKMNPDVYLNFDDDLKSGYIQLPNGTVANIKVEFDSEFAEEALTWYSNDLKRKMDAIDRYEANRGDAV